MVASGDDVMVDRSGKANGRGVYICPAEECLEKALKRHSITRGLGIDGLSVSGREKLKTEINNGIPSAEV
jgi:predicted RNA-binding protein YlxR (DUF448 family)